MQKIIHVLDVSIDKQRVYQALTTEEGLSSWWSTKVKTDGKLGGIIGFTFLEGFNPDMKILSLEENSKVEWECVSGHDKWQNNKFSFEMKENQVGTLLKFTQEYANQVSDEDYGRYNFNWAYYLQSLKDYCETGNGKPYQA